jgi:hypothetical protein
VQHLRNEIHVGNQGSLQNNGNIRGVEEFDGIRSYMPSNFSIFERKVDSESLEVNHHKINEDSGDKLVDVREMATVKGLL